MKTTSAAILATAIVVGTGAVAAPRSYNRVSWWASARAVPVAAYANDARLSSDALMLKGLGRTVLPMRVLFTALGADVTWNPVERAVYAWKSDGTGVRFVVGKRRAETLIVNDRPSAASRPTVSETRELDAPPMLIGNSVYIPVRAATEALGADVRWVGSGPAIYLTTDQSTANGSPSADWDADLRALNMSLKVSDRRVRSGEPVSFNLTLENIGRRPITLPFATGQRFDFTVSRGGRLVWDWARGRAFTESLAPLRLLPGERTSFSATWDQIGSDGRRVSPGTYQVQARVVVPVGRRPLTVIQPVTITR